MTEVNETLSIGERLDEISEQLSKEFSSPSAYAFDELITIIAEQQAQIERLEARHKYATDRAADALSCIGNARRSTSGKERAAYIEQACIWLAKGCMALGNETPVSG